MYIYARVTPGAKKETVQLTSTTNERPEYTITVREAAERSPTKVISIE